MIPPQSVWSDETWYAAAEDGTPEVVAEAVRHFENRLSSVERTDPAGEGRILFLLANLSIKLFRAPAPIGGEAIRLLHAKDYAYRAFRNSAIPENIRLAAGSLAAVIHLLMAQGGIDTVSSLLLAAQVGQEVREQGTPGTSPYITATIAEGDAWSSLAKEGGHGPEGFLKAASAFRAARRHTTANRPLYVMALRREATALTEWVKYTTPSENVLRRATSLCRLAVTVALDPVERGLAQLNLAVVMTLAARFSAKPADKLHTGEKLAREARKLFPTSNYNHGLALVTEATALSLLGELGEDAEAHFEHAIRLCRRARRSLRGTSDAESILVRVGTYINESVAWLSLAEHERGNSIAHLRRARRLCHLAAVVAAAPLDRVQALLNGANACVLLAERDIAPVQNARSAIARYQEARGITPHATVAHGSSFANEANAHKILGAIAKRRRTKKKQFKAAIHLYKISFSLLPPGSVSSGWVQCNAADTYLRLARLPYYSRRHVDSALICLHRAADIGEAAADAALCAFAHRWAGEIYRRYGSSLNGLISAYEEFTDALRAIERMRSAVSGEDRLRRHQGEYLQIYVACTRTCLDLALFVRGDTEGEGPSIAPSGRVWEEEGWYWWESARQRTLVDLLHNARPRLDTRPKRRAWERWLASEQNAKATSASPTTRSVTIDRPPTLLHAASTAAPSAESAHKRESERIYKLNHLLKVLTDGRDLLPSALSSGPEVWRPQLMNLAGMGLTPEAPQCNRKPLLVEFGPFDEQGYVLFLLPLWPHPHGGHLTPIHVKVPLSVRERAVTATRIAVREFTAALTLTNPLDREVAVGRALFLFDPLPSLLGDGFLRPWEPELRKFAPSELIIIPNAETQNLPFHSARYGTEPLLQYFPVTYLPSATIAEELVSRRMLEPPTTAPLSSLVMGVPTAQGQNGLSSIAAAGDEAIAVAKAFGVEPYLAEDMQTKTLMYWARRARWVHLCTHSRFCPNRYEESEIAFYDRPLRLFEFFHNDRLFFPHAELWYQGSCESALSSDDGSGELLGLIRALLFAGPRCVLATLWSVEDRSSALFARAFYRALIAGSSKAEAHRQACLDLMARPQWASPAFSTPFVIYGETYTGAPTELRGDI